MKRVFILFVVGHLVMDLAVPSAGAFRFNPDESVVAVRVQPVQAQDLASAPRAEPLRVAVEVPYLELTVSADLRGNRNAPDLIALLPRRDPSSDRSPQSLSEDA